MKIDSVYNIGRTEVEASTSFLPLCITVTLSSDGCSYLQKHGAVHVTNNEDTIICNVVLIGESVT